MSKRKQDLPIILSHSTRTGIMSLPNRKMGGRDLIIVGLNREVPTGEEFEMEDIDWIKTVLHFGDIQSLQVTVDCLAKELKRWTKEQEDE